MENPEGQLGETVLQACAVVVILTEGSLECKEQLQVVIDCMKASETSSDVPLLIPVNTPSFRFPSSDFYSKDLPALYPDRAYVSDLVKTFFNRIAVCFSTNASDHIMMTQALEVQARIPVRKSRIRSSAQIAGA